MTLIDKEQSKQLKAKASALRFFTNANVQAILAVLQARNELPVKEIQHATGIEQPQCSNYLAQLQRMGLVVRRKYGQQRRYSPVKTKISEFIKLADVA
jgi:DNA-binding transcriptional ArsR family regulator